MAGVRARVAAATRLFGAELRGLMPEFDDGSFGVIATYLYLSQYRTLHESLLREQPSGAEILDWGAGLGHFAHVQQRLGNRVTAYTLADANDPRYSEVLRRLGRRVGYAVVEGADPVRLPFPDSSFDAVVSCGVLEHVREVGGSEAGSLGEIARVLRSGGRFYCLHFPSRGSWIEFVNRRLGRAHHAYTYDRGDIRDLAAASGLQLRGHRRYGVLPKIRPAKHLGRLADNRGVVAVWYGLDEILRLLVVALAQNHYFVLEKASA